MFKFSKTPSRWSLGNYDLVDKVAKQSYPFNKMFAAFSEQDEQITLWLNNQYLATLSADKKVFESLVSSGVRICSDTVPIYKISDFSYEKTIIQFTGPLVLINNKLYELSQLVVTESDSGELLLANDGNQLATIVTSRKNEFIDVYQCALDNSRRSMTGEALATYEAEIAKEQADLRAIREEQQRAQDYKKAAEAGFPDIVLTTEAISPFKVKQRLGIVSAEYAHRSKILQQFMAQISSIGQQRDNSTQTALKQAKETVLLELRREAYLLGAHAVIAVDLDYSEITGAGDPLLFLVANGTAITIDKD